MALDLSEICITWVDLKDTKFRVKFYYIDLTRLNYTKQINRTVLCYISFHDTVIRDILMTDIYSMLSTASTKKLKLIKQ